MKIIVFFKGGKIITYTNSEIPTDSGNVILIKTDTGIHYNNEDETRKAEVAIMKHNIERIEIIING